VEPTQWLRQRVIIFAAIAAIVVVGMAVSFWINPLTGRASAWFVPSDLWDTFRASQYVAWGFEGEIYRSQTFFDSFPGIAVLLAPVAKLTGLWHMSESFPLHLVRPTSWLILGPVELILGGVVLFPLDALARHLDVPARRRVALTCLEAALVWPVVAIWGHPEYTVALAFGIYGLLAAFNGRWVRVGVYFGLALLFQPLTLLVLPVALTFVAPRKWIRVGSIIALPSALLLIPPLVKEWSATTYYLLRQPNYPSGDHPTPWIYLAPVLERAHIGLLKVAELVKNADGKKVLKEVAVHARFSEVVSAGPGRVIAIVLACAIGLWVARKRPPLVQVVWWAGVALSLRCVFECVMNPYYLMPGLALALVAAAVAGRSRLLLTVLFAAASSYLSYRHMETWTYYTVVTGLLLLTLAAAWPGARATSPDTDHEVGDGAAPMRPTTAVPD
jgi:hypothetical protein